MIKFSVCRPCYPLQARLLSFRYLLYSPRVCKGGSPCFCSTLQADGSHFTSLTESHWIAPWLIILLARRPQPGVLHRVFFGTRFGLWITSVTASQNGQEYSYIGHIVSLFPFCVGFGSAMITFVSMWFTFDFFFTTRRTTHTTYFNYGTSSTKSWFMYFAMFRSCNHFKVFGSII